MGVARRQQDAAQAVRRQVVADVGDEGGAEALAAGGGGDVHVAEPGEGGAVGDDAGVTDLPAPAGAAVRRTGLVEAEVERPRHRAVLALARAPECPVGVRGEPVVDEGQVQPVRVGGDFVTGRNAVGHGRGGAPARSVGDAVVHGRRLAEEPPGVERITRRPVRGPAPRRARLPVRASVSYTHL